MSHSQLQKLGQLQSRPFLSFIFLIGVCLLLALVYWAYEQVTSDHERENAERHFRESYQEIADTTNDSLVFEENVSGDVKKGDGEVIHKDCFTGEASLIFGTSRPFDEVIEEYQTDLQVLNYEPFEKNPVVQFQDTPDARGLYWFYSKEISIDIHRLLESKGELTSYALDRTEYETYYLISLEIMYPSYAACQLVGY